MQWEADGHLVVRAAVDGATVEHLGRHCDALPGDALRTAALDRDPVLAAIAADDRLVAIARSVLPGEPEPFGATFVVKAPHTGLPALWHQDGHPWRERGIAEAVTLWVAIDEATAENGCLRVIPGSHRLDAQPLRPNADVPSIFGAEVDPALVDESLAVDVVLAPGDVSVHHPNLLHGSGPNATERQRRALALRYRTVEQV